VLGSEEEGMEGVEEIDLGVRGEMEREGGRGFLGGHGG